MSSKCASGTAERMAGRASMRVSWPLRCTSLPTETITFFWVKPSSARSAVALGCGAKWLVSIPGAILTIDLRARFDSAREICDCV